MPQKILYGHGMKTVLTIPWTVDELQYGQGQREKVKGEQDAYEKVPLVFRAIKLRRDSLVRVPLTILEGEKEVDDWHFSETMPIRRFLALAETSLLMRGGAFFVRLRNPYGGEFGLQWLNPFTMEVKMYGSGLNAEPGFIQHVEGHKFPEGHKYPEGHKRREDFKREERKPEQRMADPRKADPRMADPRKADSRMADPREAVVSRKPDVKAASSQVMVY